MFHSFLAHVRILEVHTEVFYCLETLFSRHLKGTVRTSYTMSEGPSFELLLLKGGKKKSVHVLVRVTAVNRHHDQGKSNKGQHLIGAGLQIQRLSPVPSRQRHGSIQAGIVQEKLRVLHLYLKAACERLTSRQLG